MSKFVNNLKQTWNNRDQILSDVQTVGLKGAITNAKGAISMTKLGAEVIGIVILCVIVAICPVICDAITKALPNVTGDWGDVTANSMFTTLIPMVQVCAIILIAALVIKAIYDFKKN